MEPSDGARYVAVMMNVILISATAISLTINNTNGIEQSFLINLYKAQTKQTKPTKTLLKPVKVINSGRDTKPG